MNALAYFLLKQGFVVSGSDEKRSLLTEALEKRGVYIYYKHSESNVANADIVVYSHAISQKNPELTYAKEMGLKIISRGELLGLISKDYSSVIAVSGTHGKTTTTSMIAEVFKNAGLKPTFHIGGTPKNLKKSFHIGEKSFFITEACEYKNSYHYLNPKYGVVLNIEQDHLDFFKNYENIVKSFRKFSRKCENVICHNLLEGIFRKATTFGQYHGDCKAKNIRQWKREKYKFDCYYKDEFVGLVKLKIFQKHNIDNALAAVAVSKANGIDNKVIIKSLNDFRGVKRRFEILGKINGAEIIIDYAHHPTAIKDAIETAKKVANKLIVIFQPHTYSRTKKLMKDFAASFCDAGEVVIYKTYPAREVFDIEGDALTLYNSLPTSLCKSYFEDYSLMKSYIISRIGKEDIVLILGAGDIDSFGTFLLQK